MKITCSSLFINFKHCTKKIQTCHFELCCTSCFFPCSTGDSILTQFPSKKSDQQYILPSLIWFIKKFLSFENQNLFIQLIVYASVVQPCHHSPHVATVCLNVATGSFSKSCISVERSNKLQFLQHISLNCGNSKETVATKVANVAIGTFWLDKAGLCNSFGM